MNIYVTILIKFLITINYAYMFYFSHMGNPRPERTPDKTLPFATGNNLMVLK